MEAFGSPNEEVCCIFCFEKHLCWKLGGLSAIHAQGDQQPAEETVPASALPQRNDQRSVSRQSQVSHGEHLGLLFKHCECTEEGTRNIVAEC